MNMLGLETQDSGSNNKRCINPGLRIGHVVAHVGDAAPTTFANISFVFTSARKDYDRINHQCHSTVKCGGNLPLLCCGLQGNTIPVCCVYTIFKNDNPKLLLQKLRSPLSSHHRSLTTILPAVERSWTI
jgi:hypothetical protein